LSAAFPRTLSEYCERTVSGFWGEPLNALSNGAFLLAALLAYVIWRREASRDWPAFVLVLVVFTIAIGSFLFHTRPSPATAAADVIPIQCFVVGYLVLALRRFLGANWLVVGLAVAGLFGLSALVGRVGDRAIAGTLAYVPGLVALFSIGIALVVRAQLAALGMRRPEAVAEAARAGLRAAYAGRWLLAAALVFLVSLTFRMIDRPLCAHWSIGTHFLWHICNALVLFLLLRTALFHDSAAARIEAEADQAG